MNKSGKILFFNCVAYFFFDKDKMTFCHISLENNLSFNTKHKLKITFELKTVKPNTLSSLLNYQIIYRRKFESFTKINTSHKRRKYSIGLPASVSYVVYLTLSPSCCWHLDLRALS